MTQIFGDVPLLAELHDTDRSRFLTRSLMALALLGEAPCDRYVSAQSITDGYDDDGIDCVFFDRLNKRLFLGQSKWFSNTNNGVQLSDFVRFRDGVDRIISATFDEQNRDLHRWRDDIESALDDINVQIFMLFSHNSEQPLSDQINSKRDEFLKRHNKFDPSFLNFVEFDLKKASDFARALSRPENIDVEAMFRNWGRKELPFEAVYGSVSALDIVSWYEKFGKALFAENLRFGIERSDVNEGITRTAKSKPEFFWYFNNGITAICDSISKRRIGGDSTDSSIFEIKRISIINGAQTVSSLFRAKIANADLANISLQLRVISLANTPEGFSVDVTTANNTQNDLNPVDFVAADENQDRLKRDCAQFGVSYSYRRGDDEPEPSNGFNIRDATVASACASGDLKLAVSAKRYISGLWENTKKEPYTKLFNDETSACWLWNIVRIARSVDENIDLLSQKLDGRDYLVAIHSNRFVLYLVFKFLDLEIHKSEIHTDDDVKRISDTSCSILHAVCDIVSYLFPDAYPGNIFKNAERQAEIESEYAKRRGVSGSSSDGATSLLDFMDIMPDQGG